MKEDDGDGDDGDDDHHDATARARVSAAARSPPPQQQQQGGQEEGGSSEEQPQPPRLVDPRLRYSFLSGVRFGGSATFTAPLVPGLVLGPNNSSPFGGDGASSFVLPERRQRYTPRHRCLLPKAFLSAAAVGRRQLQGQQQQQQGAGYVLTRAATAATVSS